MMQRLLAATLLALIAVPPQALPARTSERAQILPAVPLSIATAGGVYRFQVEVARTSSQQELGLMYRTRMAPRHGMIFPMSPPRRATFWMKNTVLPLDLLFIRADDTIARIAADAKPYSLDVLDSHEDVAAVLELNAGTAAKLGIRRGDRVSWAGR